MDVYKIYFNADEIYIFHVELLSNSIQIRTEDKIYSFKVLITFCLTISIFVCQAIKTPRAKSN